MNEGREGKRYPEAMTNIFFTILDRTPLGGAAVEDLQEAYREVKDCLPSERTIYRMIKRLQLLFDPLAYGETPEETEDPENGSDKREEEKLPAPRMGIKRVKRNKKTYYLFEGELAVPQVNVNEMLLTALSLYPHHRSILKDSFQGVMKKLLSDTMVGLSSYVMLVNDINSYVYVAEPIPADSQKHGYMMKEAFRAIRERKKVQLQYLRTYNGAFTERVVEPYGLLCRFNNWYLTGFCLEKKERRLFLLYHIRKFEVLEDSRFRMPQNFSLSKEYDRVWAVHTANEPGKEETVRLKVNKGIAERLRALKFHHSQKLKKLPNGDAEVTFHLSGAEEMVPWLLSWGSGIQILEPQWLRDEAVKTLEQTLEQYKSSSN